MSLDANHTDLVIQYALLLAGEEEDQFDRQLGPIHLVKYVFLADLAYAQRYEGSSFTGARWRFHNFGPWDAAVFNRIEPAANAISAQVMKFESNYGDDDWVRYRLRDSDKLRELEKQIPTPVKLLLPRHVHKFLGDTPSLLDFVYKTEPMINAAPKEDLDFSVVIKAKPGDDEQSQIQSSSSTVVPGGRQEPDTAQLRHERLSNKKKKRFHERVRVLHAKQVAKPKLINPVTKPRYDDVYEQGVAWLEELAGSQGLESGEFTAEFSDDVWRSASRKGQDVS